jgi:hypothetical protein
MIEFRVPLGPSVEIVDEGQHLALLLDVVVFPEVCDESFLIQVSQILVKVVPGSLCELIVPNLDNNWEVVPHVLSLVLLKQRLFEGLVDLWKLAPDVSAIGVHLIERRVVIQVFQIGLLDRIEEIKHVLFEDFLMSWVGLLMRPLVPVPLEDGKSDLLDLRNLSPAEARDITSFLKITKDLLTIPNIHNHVAGVTLKHTLKLAHLLHQHTLQNFSIVLLEVFSELGVVVSDEIVLSVVGPNAIDQLV